MKNIGQGSSEYLVLVHGALTDGSMWNEHLEYLASDFDVLPVNLRCFNERDVGEFGLNTHADDLIELVTQLAKEHSSKKKHSNNKPINLVGWSYGADVVLNALAKQALPVSNVFLYEPGYPGCLQASQMDAWQLDADKMFGPVFEQYLNHDLEGAVKSLIDASGNSEGYFLSQSKSVQALQLAKGFTLNHQLNQKEQPLIDAETLSRIQVPISLAYGETTRDLFKLVTIRTSELLANGKLYEVPGEGHMLPQENPKAFSSLIKTMISP